MLIELLNLGYSGNQAKSIIRDYKDFPNLLLERIERELKYAEKYIRTI